MEFEFACSCPLSLPWEHTWASMMKVRGGERLSCFNKPSRGHLHPLVSATLSSVNNPAHIRSGQVRSGQQRPLTAITDRGWVSLLQTSWSSVSWEKWVFIVCHWGFMIVCYTVLLDNRCQKGTYHVLYLSFPKILVGIVKRENWWHLHLLLLGDALQCTCSQLDRLKDNFLFLIKLISPQWKSRL